MKYKVGLVGCGRIGYTFDLDSKRSGIWTHAGAYNHSDDINFASVYDPDTVVAIECAQRYGAEAVRDVNQLVGHDIVSFAVPEHLHETILDDFYDKCISAGSSPKILWVEKPFTGNLETARRITEMFARLGCHIHINYQRRYCDGFVKLQNFGTPKHVSIVYTRGLLNTASHFVDLMTGLYGDPEAVYPTGAIEITLYGTIGTLSKTDFVMSYEDFDISLKMLNGTKYNQNHILYYYDDKIVEVPPLQTQFKIQSVVTSNQYSEYKDLGSPEVLKLDYAPMENQIRVFVDAIRTGDYSKLNNGLQSLSVIKKVLR
jgi:predicted dehydrogenase